MPDLDAPVRTWLYERLADLFDGVPASFDDPPTDPKGWPQSIAESLSLLASAPIDHETLACDHVGLFVNAPGGVPAPPYASWYLDGTLHGPTCDWVAAAYAAQGLDLDPNAGEPADYLGAELEFLFFLGRHEIAARATGDADALRTVLHARARFTGHMARWIPAFVERVRAAAPSGTVHTAAGLLAALVAEERRELPFNGEQGDCQHGIP